jgi:hypothetical protein
MQALGMCFVGMTFLLVIGNVVEILQSSLADATGARIDRTDPRVRRAHRDRDGVRIVDFADAARVRGQARNSHWEHASSNRHTGLLRHSRSTERRADHPRESAR